MLTDYILRMDAHGRRMAFIEQGVYRARSRSYAATLDRARAMASWLTQQQMAGRPVILWAAPSPDWAVAFYGCVLAGAVVVPIDAGFSAGFVERVKAKTGATLVMTAETFAAIDALPAAPGFMPAAAKSTDVAEIVFTSGTTSEPRGVTITHGNLLANLEPVEREIERYRWMARPFSPLGFLNLIPLSHLFGQVMGLFIPQFLGGTVIFTENQAPAFIAATLKRRRASVMVSVPQQLETLAAWTRVTDAAPRGGVLARWWRYRRVHRALGWKMWAFVVGGAPLPPAVDRVWSAMGYAVVQGYGLTETAPAVAITHPFRKRQGSVGIRLAGVETRVAEDGEILVRGANVSPSAETDAEGWLHTGDLGRVDEGGNLYYLGRKKDVIVTAAGLNVYPEDVERALTAQPEIREAAVVAAGGVAGGGRSTVHAVIVGDGDIAAAVARANQTLEAYQRVQGFSIWPDAALPRTVSTQKLQRSAIAQWLAGAARPAAVAKPRLTPEEILADQGLSSLDRVELLTQLEVETGISVATLAAPGAAEPDWPQSAVARGVRAVFRPLVLFPLLRTEVKIEAIGVENLDRLQGPALFISNHQNYLDVPAILRALPPRYRATLAPAMSPDHFPNWLLLNLTRLCFNGFLLSPSAEAVQSALRQASRLVEAGHSILVFPEGRLTPDGKIHAFRPGVGLMAERLGLPVVSLRLEGLYERQKKGRVTIGEPVVMRPDETAAAFVGRLRDWYR